MKSFLQYKRIFGLLHFKNKKQTKNSVKKYLHSGYSHKNKI